MLWPQGKNLALLVAIGALGYAGQAFCYFGALQHASAGLTALWLYLYPVIVTNFSAMLSRKRLSRLRVTAVLSALVGTGLAVGGSLHGSETGIVLGVGAALIYSICILVGERVTEAEGTIASATVVMLSGAVVYGLMVLWHGPNVPASIGGGFAVDSIALLSTMLLAAIFLGEGFGGQ